MREIGVVSWVSALCAVAFAGAVMSAEPERKPMKFTIPESMKTEHAELHDALESLTRSGGRTAEAAQGLAQALHPHFGREEEIALPPLGLLEPLAAGQVDPAMRQILGLTDQLKSEMPRMLAEHKDIATHVARLREAAQAENRADGVQFADHLARHARSEEEVTYPAAVLVGEYLRLKLGGR